MTATATRTAKAEPATPGDLIVWLLANGFTREDTRKRTSYGIVTAWYRKGMVRVVIEDEGYFNIYRFDDSYPKADVLAWDAKFAHAPLSIVTATIKNA